MMPDSYAAHQLHEGGVADAALEAADRVQPLAPLPQRLQVPVLLIANLLLVLMKWKKEFAMKTQAVHVKNMLKI